MINLVKLGEKTYVLESPVNVGFYKLNENDVVLIDSGNSKDFGKIIAKVLIENNWNLKIIINTHSHADHIGGNKYLQDKYHCKIYASKVESYFINETMLEPSLLYGAKPLKGLVHHMLYAKPSVCEDIANVEIEGIEIVNLIGHSFGLIGVVTSDNVIFVGDAYTSAKILEKYAIQYTYDVDNFLKTLQFLKESKYDFYVPAHGEIEKNPIETININEENAMKIENEILNIASEGVTFNNLLVRLSEIYHINLNIVQYHLIGTTLKAYLTKLENDGKIEICFENGEMIIRKITGNK